MDTINPIIISSKPAEKHLEKIKALHSNLMEGMANQAMKVQAFNQQKDMERKDQMMRDTEMNQRNKEMTMNSEHQTADRQANSEKANLDYNLKSKELEVKKMALTTPE